MCSYVQPIPANVDHSCVLNAYKKHIFDTARLSPCKIGTTGEGGASQGTGSQFQFTQCNVAAMA